MLDPGPADIASDSRTMTGRFSAPSSDPSHYSGLAASFSDGGSDAFGVAGLRDGSRAKLDIAAVREGFEILDFIIYFQGVTLDGSPVANVPCLDDSVLYVSSIVNRSRTKWRQYHDDSTGLLVAP